MCSSLPRTRSQSVSDAQGPHAGPLRRTRRPTSQSRRPQARSPLSPPSSPLIDRRQSYPHNTALDPQFAYSVSHQIAKWDVREWNDDVARHRGKRVRYSVDLSSSPARPSSSTSCPVLHECERPQSNDPLSPITLTRSSTSIFLHPSKERTRLPSTSSAFFAVSTSSSAPPAPPPSEDGQDETSGTHDTHNKPPSWSIFSDGAAIEDAFSRLTHGDVAEGSSESGGWDPPRKMDLWAERYDRDGAWAYCSGGRAGDGAGDAMTEDGEAKCVSVSSHEGCRKTRGSKRRLERDGDEDEKSDGEGWQVVEPFPHDLMSRPLSPTLSSFASTSSLPVSPPPFRGQDPDVDIESAVDIDGDLEMRLTSNVNPMFPDSPLPISISILHNNSTPSLGTLPVVPESLWSQLSLSPYFSRSSSRSGSGTPTSISTPLSGAPLLASCSAIPNPIPHHYSSFPAQPSCYPLSSSSLRAVSVDAAHHSCYHDDRHSCHRP